MSEDFYATLFGTTKIVPLSVIDLDTANRRTIDEAHVKELATSIHRFGLINPVTLYQEQDQLRYRLLAGAHRYLAVASLGHPAISARVFARILNEYEMKAIEIYENIHRKNLSVVESEQQVARLHEIMQTVHGKSTTGQGATGHRIKDTAHILGRSVGSVADALKFDKIVQQFPELELSKYKNKSEALRAIKRFATVVHNQHISATSTTISRTLADSFITGDFFDNTLPDGQFAMIECDPPYAIDLVNARKNADQSAIRADYTEISAEDYPNFLHRLCAECYRLATPNAWFILWHGAEWYKECHEALRNTGWTAHNVSAIWKKGNSTGQSQSPDCVLGNAYEMFAWARKGSPKLRIPGRSNVFDIQPVPAQQKIHPTERPVALITEILRTFTWPQTSVLCPFLGSGNTILAARDLNMLCIGFELSKIYRDAFVARHSK